jgi:aromatic ring-opening dioxygenase LigB subunit
MGGGRAEQCKATTEAMAKAAEEIVDAKPDRVIVFDPHLTRYPSCYACVDMLSVIRGDFKAFGRADLKAEFPSEPDFYKYLAKHASDNRFSVTLLEADELDHGAMVPLWFLGAAGFSGSVCILGFPWKSHQQTHTEFGRMLRQAVGGYGGRTAIIASGDMSHRLQYGAPSGYNPRAIEFDNAFRGHVEAGELFAASQIPVDLRDLAAEDSSESMAMAAGAVGETVTDAKVLSYEAPFGVGYLVAVLA